MDRGEGKFHLGLYALLFMVALPVSVGTWRIQVGSGAARYDANILFLFTQDAAYSSHRACLDDSSSVFFSRVPSAPHPRYSRATQ